MKKLLKWTTVLLVVLVAHPAWAVLEDGNESLVVQPMFVATINGMVFEMTSARDVAEAALARGISLSDMVNGLSFAGAPLGEIIGGALDFGTAAEAIAQVLVDSGYRADQVVLAAQGVGVPAAMVERIAAQVGIMSDPMPAPLGYAATRVDGLSEEDCAREVRPEFDRAMTEAAARGENAEDVVRSLLERGFDLCGVVKSAVERGENLDDIFTGARAAGYSREMVAREATAAGSSEGEVLLALRNTELLGLGYTPGTERAAGFSAMTPIQGSVGGNVRGRVVSEFTF